MKGVERVVEHVLNHREALLNFGRLAVEVYIAYILERLIEHFHAAIGTCLARLLEKVKKDWESVAEDVLPDILEKIKKAVAMMPQTAKSLWEKASEFFHRILRKKQ